MEAHTPYQPSTPFARRFGWIPDSASNAEIRRLRTIGRLEPEEKPVKEALHAQRAYEGAIAELDAEVGAMLEDLRARGLLENTLVVITADHGEEFGEHGVFGHGNSLYYQSLHVPLVMVMPGKLPAGRRVGTAVSLRDIPATIADLATLGTTFPGASMRTLWEQTSTPWHVALSEIRHEPDLIEASRARLGDLASAVDDSAQVIRNPDGTWETFAIIGNGLREIPGDTLSARVARLRAALPPPRSDVTTASASKRAGSR
jgi:arylsulfatase A-like enzyme